MELLGKKKPATMEKQPLVRLFLVYLDGAPHLMVESAGTEGEVLKMWHDAIEFPEGVKIEVRPATAVPVEDLERVKLMVEMKMHCFNMAQIQLAIRAGKSNLVLPGGPAAPGQAH